MKIIASDNNGTAKRSIVMIIYNPLPGTDSSILKAVITEAPAGEENSKIVPERNKTPRMVVRKR
jgi:hypothetical protein